MPLNFMTQRPSYPMTVLLLSVGISGCAPIENTYNYGANAPEQNTATGEAFAVNGERIDVPVPDNWKLAYMEGNPDGEYFAEYIPADEDIDNWQTGYLLVKRFEYIPSLESQKGDLTNEQKQQNALAMVEAYQQVTANGCGGALEEMSVGNPANTRANLAVSGGFCDEYGAKATFGEGSVFGFTVGDAFIHQVSYHWRPASEEASQSNLPWRIAPSKLEQYLLTMKNVRLCGAEDQASCQHNTL